MKTLKSTALSTFILMSIALFSFSSFAKPPLCEKLYQSAININKNLVWKYDKKLKKKIPIAYGFKLWSQYTHVKFFGFKFPGFNACARTFSAISKGAIRRLPLRSDIDRGRVWRMQGFLSKNPRFKTIAVKRLQKKCQQLHKKNKRLPRKKRKTIACKTYQPQRGDVIVWAGTKARTQWAKKLGYPNAKLQHIGVYIGRKMTMDSEALSGQPKFRPLKRSGYEVEYAYRPQGNCQ